MKHPLWMWREGMLAWHGPLWLGGSALEHGDERYRCTITNGREGMGGSEFGFPHPVSPWIPDLTDLQTVRLIDETLRMVK